MHSGFSALRSSLPMNIKGHFPKFKLWSRAQADVDRIVAIWSECLQLYQGPYLFGSGPCIADAMFAPVVTRFMTYDVALDSNCAQYCRTILALPPMQEWVAGARAEPDEIEELEAEF
jgi:glutathione S-transferase